MQAVAVVPTVERRAFTRRDVTWRLRLHRDDGEACDALCTDIGNTGVGFQTAAILRAGELVDLEFPGGGGDAPEPHPGVRAQIIYRIGDQYGAAFVSTSQ